MDGWILVGFLGQGIFGTRFLVQWISSEKKRRSYVPVAFWYISILGGTVLFLYAMHIKDPVFTVGQGLGLVIYFRNLMLIKQHKTFSSTGPSAS